MENKRIEVEYSVWFFLPESQPWSQNNGLKRKGVDY